MRIILDAFGGDNAPLEIIKGAVLGIEENKELQITLVGREDEIKRIMSENELSDHNIDIVHAPDILSMEDDPMQAVKNGKETSLIKGLYMLAAGEGDAYVSAGSTGSIVIGASLIVKRIKGLRRAALATMIPATPNPFMLLDAGASLEVSPEVLSQFGLMGSIYMEQVMGVPNPRVGLVNIGTEETKGNELQREAFKIMQNAGYNFVGNVEGRDLPVGGCDVAVTDGFTGNVILKVCEGMGMLIKDTFKDIFGKNILTKSAALISSKGLKNFAQMMDYKEYGGAPLMGTRKPVIKAHGSSNAQAISSALKQAVKYVNNDVIGKITDHINTEEEQKL